MRLGVVDQYDLSVSCTNGWLLRKFHRWEGYLESRVQAKGWDGQSVVRYGVCRGACRKRTGGFCRRCLNAPLQLQGWPRRKLWRTPELLLVLPQFGYSESFVSLPGSAGRL